MSGDRDGQLRGGNSAAVIAHADQTNATALNIDFDAVGAGVQDVFNELFDDGGGALDDLACGDLVYELTGKDTNRHRARSLACPIVYWRGTGRAEPGSFYAASCLVGAATAARGVVFGGCACAWRGG